MLRWMLTGRWFAAPVASIVVASIVLAAVVAAADVPALAQEADSLPVSRDPRIKVELFAESPQLVTPTGIDVDQKGRVWVIESNTHFPPAEYKGHPSDRVLILQDADGNGRADAPVVFTDGLKFTMSVNVRPNGEVYLATRHEIFLMQDDNGDGQADRRKRIVYLETDGNYPHNGLAGFAFDALDWMYFGFGENLGASYAIVGTDGTSLKEGGEGGNVYRCRLDGSQLTRVATGFWNPHASCMDAFGRLFTVDNDPDSRPPCRLLHVVPEGDYGYRFRLGRKGLHPFTAWNGEIPGTLPMVCGTGEAPSGIVAYENDGLPAEYVGNLFVTSWGDHRIDRFQLRPQGASFSALLEPLITGGENFRPVGLAVAPDGSLFCSDWVLRDYKLHSRGRVWRIAPVKPPERKVVNLATLLPATNAATTIPAGELQRLLGSPRIEVRRAAARSLAQNDEGRKFLARKVEETAATERERIEALWALAGAMPGKVAVSAENVLAAHDAVSTAYVWLTGKEGGAERQLLNRVTTALDQGTPTKDRGADPCFVLAAIANSGNLASSPDLAAFASREDPFVFSAIVAWLGTKADLPLLAERTDPSKEKSPRCRLAMLLAARMRWSAAPLDVALYQNILSRAFQDPDADVRRAAVQWVAEGKLKEFRSNVEAVLSDGSVSTDLFLATIAALELLDGADPAAIDKSPVKYVLPLVRDEKRSPAVRAQALRLTPPTDPSLDAELLKRLLASPDAGLQLEAIRTLQSAPIPERVTLLRSVALDESRDRGQRLEAVMGLSAGLKPGDPDEAARQTLIALTKSSDRGVQREALRGLRNLAEDSSIRQALQAACAPLHNAPPTPDNRELADQLALALDPEVPADVKPLLTARPIDRSQWNKVLDSPGDAVAGRRSFFHARGAGCANCHTINGRGGRVGPDLSTIGRTLSRERLIDSILEPSKEVAPQFVAWVLEDKAGKIYSGLIVSENEGHTILGNADGAIVDVPTSQIVERVPQKISLMPEKLTEKMTVSEFRDLLAFLESLK